MYVYIHVPRPQSSLRKFQIEFDPEGARTSFIGLQLFSLESSWWQYSFFSPAGGVSHYDRIHI